MTESKIPLTRPLMTGNEITYLAQALASGHIAGAGPFTKKCEAYLESELGVRRVLMTSSGTHALDMAALLLVEAGDEVIVTSFTFVSTVNAFVLRGARPVFVDIRPDTLNIDHTQVERHISPRTKVIVVMHYAGISCEMDPILDVAARHGIAVVEDNAHGLFGSYTGRPLGSIGALAALSFHETKNFTCGEGGALIINDERYLARAEIIREKGTDRARFLRREVDKYRWVDVGSSYLMSDMQAAFLYAQFEARDRIQDERRRVWRHYLEHLPNWAKERQIGLPTVPANCHPAYHLFYLLMPSYDQRQALTAHLAKRRIYSTFHFLALHRSPMGLRLTCGQSSCPVSEAASDRLLRIPFFPQLRDHDLDRILVALDAF